MAPTPSNNRRNFHAQNPQTGGERGDPPPSTRRPALHNEIEFDHYLKRLAWAILQEAHGHLLPRGNGVQRTQSERDRLRFEAVVWVWHSNPNYVFGFNTTCQLLGLSPQAVRHNWRQQGILPDFKEHPLSTPDKPMRSTIRIDSLRKTHLKLVATHSKFPQAIADNKHGRIQPSGRKVKSKRAKRSHRPVPSPHLAPVIPLVATA